MTHLLFESLAGQYFENYFYLHGLLTFSKIVDHDKVRTEIPTRILKKILDICLMGYLPTNLCGFLKALWLPSGH